MHTILNHLNTKLVYSDPHCSMKINFSFCSRPFGVALLFAGFDPDHGSQLFHMDPSGTYVQYDAKAIGSGSEGAQQSLQVHSYGYHKCS